MFQISDRLWGLCNGAETATRKGNIRPTGYKYMIWTIVMTNHCIGYVKETDVVVPEPMDGEPEGREALLHSLSTFVPFCIHLLTRHP